VLLQVALRPMKPVPLALAVAVPLRTLAPLPPPKPPTVLALPMRERGGSDAPVPELAQLPTRTRRAPAALAPMP
jgi:hypothetical protein